MLQRTFILLGTLFGIATSASAQAVLQTEFGPLKIFPDDNAWNQDVSQYSVHPKSATYLNSIGLSTRLKADFGTVWDGAPNGMPYSVVRGTQAKVPVTFQYDDESDPGPYPIPPNVGIEGGPNSTGDRHVLVLDYDNKKLYELFAAYPQANGSWTAGSGAIFDLTSNKLRPAGWTSADAAGLPIFPALVKYEEVQEGEIRHALRFTVPRTQRAYVYPATHYASSSSDTSLPPMGLRLRLKASYSISGFPAKVQVILRALKKHGMILADNGTGMYIQGVPNPLWNDDELGTLRQVPASAFDVVETKVPSTTPPPTTAPKPVLSWSFVLQKGTATRVAVGPDNGVYMCGYFSGTVDFDPGTAVTNVTSTGRESGFIAKYDSQKKLLWAKAVLSTDLARISSVAVNSNGKVYIYGGYTGTATLGHGESKVTSITSGDFGTGPGKAANAYIAMLDGTNGALVWATALNGSAILLPQGDIATDTAGRALVQGMTNTGGTLRPYRGTTPLGTTTATLSTNALFMVRLDNLGNPGSTYNFSSTVLPYKGRGIAAGPQDSIFMAGGLAGTTDFDPGTGVHSVSKPTNASNVTFVSRFTSAGALTWVTTDSGPGTTANSDIASRLALGPGGEAYVTGFQKMYKNGQSGSLAKLDASGNWGWMKALSQQGEHVTTDAAGNVYVTAADHPVTRYTPAGDTTWASTTPLNVADFAVGPTGDIYFLGNVRWNVNTSPTSTKLMNAPSGTTVPVPFLIRWLQQ